PPAAPFRLAEVAWARPEPVGRDHHEGEEDQRRADQVEAAGAGLDLGAEDEAEERDRDRAEADVPAEFRLVTSAAHRDAQLVHPGPGDLQQLGAEVEEDGGRPPGAGSRRGARRVSVTD